MKKHILSLFALLCLCLVLPTTAMALPLTVPDYPCNSENCDGSYINGFCSDDNSHYQSATQDSNGVYQIGNAGQLYWFAAKVNGGETTINAKLTEDITINTGVLNADGTLSDNSANFRAWTPIGDTYNSYSGTFDGNGKSISGLYYNSSDQNVGLFGYISSYGTVQNVTLADSYIHSDGATSNVWVGGIAGTNMGSITGCANFASISGAGSSVHVGGIAGQNDNSVQHCTNSGYVSGTANSDGLCVGGITGESTIATANCCNTGSVNGCNNSSGAWASSYIGGVVGLNQATYTTSSITNCYSTGSVSSTGSVNNNYVGGVVGDSCSQNPTDGNDTITNCYYQTDTVSAPINAVGHQDTASNITNVAGKSAADFASGEVTWLLNEETSEGTLVWYQNLSETNGDAAPVFDSKHGTVYQGYKYCKVAYANDTNDLSDTPTHNYSSTTGKCGVCGEDCPHTSWNTSGASVTCNTCGVTAKVLGTPSDGSGEAMTETYYASLGSASAARCAGVKLLSDCDENAGFSSSLSIDLNGHRLTSLTVSNGDSDLTVTDSVGTGYIGTLSTGGSMKLYGGSYGEIKKANQSILPEGYAFQNNTTDDTSMVERSEISGDLTNVKVVKCKDHSVTGGVCEYCNGQFAASITKSGSTTYYASFNAAYTAAGDNDTITLLGNAKLESATAYYPVIDKNITLALNGQTLTGTNQNYGGDDTYIVIASAVTIQGSGTINWLQVGRENVSGENVDVKLTGGVTIAKNVSVIYSGKLTIKSATINGTLNVGSGYYGSGTLIMSGGSAANMNVYPDSAVTLSGGSFGSVTRRSESTEVGWDDRDGPIYSEDWTKTPTFGQMLATGYAFKTTDGMWYDQDSNLNTNSIDDVEVKPLPIKSLTITANGSTTPEYGYTTAPTFTAAVTQPAGAGSVNYQWGIDGVDSDTFTVYVSEATFPIGLGVGQYTLRCIVNADGYYTMAEISVNVVPKSLASTDCTVALSQSEYPYDGASKKPTLTVTDGDAPLTEGTDYTVSGLEEKSAVGTYTVTVTGMGNYTGEVKRTWTIKPIEVYISQFLPSLTYNGGTAATSASVGFMSTNNGTLSLSHTVESCVFDSANAGEQTYTATVTLTDANYKLVAGTLPNNITSITIDGDGKTATIVGKATIQKADAPTGVTADEIKQVYTKAEGTADLSRIIKNVPTDAGTVSYAVRNISAGMHSAAINGATLSFTLDGEGQVNTEYPILVAVSSTNYTTVDVIVTVKLVAKEAKELTVSVDGYGWTYGDTAKMPTVTGLPDGATPTYEYEGTTIMGQTYSAQAAVPTDAGEYTVKVSYETKTELWSGTAAFTISPGDISDAVITPGDSLTYSGGKQTQSVASVTLGGKALTVGTDYTVTGNTGTDAGDYRLTVNGTGNYTGTATADWTIAPKPIGVSGVTASKTYDSFTTVSDDDVQAVSFDGLVAGDTLTLNEDYTVKAEFADKNVGTGKEVRYTVRLNNANYTFGGEEGETASGTSATGGTITKAAAPTDLIDRTVSYTGSSDEIAVYLANSGLPADAGTPSYALAAGSAWAKADVNAVTGAVTIKDITGNDTLTVKISSQNYQDAYVRITLEKTEKKLPTVTLSEITVTFSGEGLLPNLIRGTATCDGESVQGQWEWVGTAPENVSDSGMVNVAFTPENTDLYDRVTAAVKVTINKGTLPQPTFDRVSASGTTLGGVGRHVNAYAELTWDDGDDTEVEQGKSYAWTLTAEIPENYDPSSITGTVVLWPKSSGSSGGGGGGSATTITVPVSSDHATVEVKAEVSKGIATVEVSDKQIEKIAADHAGEVTIDVSGLKNVESATVPSHVVEKTNEAENTALTVSLPAGSVSLDETALESVTETANGKDVTVSVVSVPTTKLPTAVKDIIGMEPTVVAVVDVNVTVNGTKQSSFNGGKVTISIPYTPKAGEDTSKLTVWFIRDDGTIENKGGYYDAKSGCFVFETEHLSQYLLINTNEMVSFSDVTADAWYAAAVNWAVKNEITGGIGNDQFGPDLSCTRAQLVTFLYRAAVAQGVDVSVGEDTNILSYTDALEIPEYAVEAFQWAVGAGIVQGYDGALMPNDDCTRGQIVTMLYRYAVATGKDVSVGADTNILSYTDFASVPEYAIAPFQWACGAGIIQGADGKLMPNDTCTRGQIVTMLYRLLGE